VNNRRLVLHLCGVVCVVAVAALLLPYLLMWRSACEVSSLRRAQWYAWTAPRLFSYCCVARGTPASAIKRRFGTPTLSHRVTDAALMRYIEMRARAGWSRPSVIRGSRVMVYEAVSGYEMIVVYYFFDRSGRLISAFASET